MTAKQYRAMLDYFDVSQAEMAEFLGISVRTSHGYANGSPIPLATQRLLRMMVKLGMKPAVCEA
jgi:hypothetical protein